MDSPSILTSSMYLSWRQRVIQGALYSDLDNGLTTVKEQMEKIEEHTAKLRELLDTIEGNFKRGCDFDKCEAALNKWTKLHIELKAWQNLMNAYITGDYSILQQD